MSTTNKETAEYPFSRMPRSREPGSERYLCKICGRGDYAHPSSPGWAEGICVDCLVNKVMGKNILICAKHGEYWGWKLQSGRVLGDCPTCHEKASQRKEALNQYGCLCVGLALVTVGYLVGTPWLLGVGLIGAFLGVWWLLIARDEYKH
jgi:hypothetical protein